MAADACVAVTHVSAVGFRRPEQLKAGIDPALRAWLALLTRPTCSHLHLRAFSRVESRKGAQNVSKWQTVGRKSTDEIEQNLTEVVCCFK